MEHLTKENRLSLMQSMNKPFIITGTVFEITNHALYYSIILVPYMNGPSDPYFVSVRLYKEDSDLTDQDYNWFRMVEPYMTIEVEVCREHKRFIDTTINRVKRIWSVIARSSVPVQYCPTYDSFNFAMNENSPIQCCGERHDIILSYTPLKTRAEYLKRKEDSNEDI